MIHPKFTPIRLHSSMIHHYSNFWINKRKCRTEIRAALLPVSQRWLERKKSSLQKPVLKCAYWRSVLTEALIWRAWTVEAGCCNLQLITAVVGYAYKALRSCSPLRFSEIPHLKAVALMWWSRECLESSLLNPVISHLEEFPSGVGLQLLCTH